MPLNERESLSIQGGRGRENRLKGEVPTHFVFWRENKFLGAAKGPTTRHNEDTRHSTFFFFRIFVFFVFIHWVSSLSIFFLFNSNRCGQKNILSGK